MRIAHLPFKNKKESLLVAIYPTIRLKEKGKILSK